MLGVLCCKCCAVLCCAVLCCAVLYSAVLCCAVLCCAVLYSAVLCCAVLCCAVLLCYGVAVSFVTYNNCIFSWMYAVLKLLWSVNCPSFSITLLAEFLPTKGRSFYIMTQSVSRLLFFVLLYMVSICDNKLELQSMLKVRTLEFWMPLYISNQ